MQAPVFTEVQLGSRYMKRIVHKTGRKVILLLRNLRRVLRIMHYCTPAWLPYWHVYRTWKYLLQGGDAWRAHRSGHNPRQPLLPRLRLRAGQETSPHDIIPGLYPRAFLTPLFLSPSRSPTSCSPPLGACQFTEYFLAA